MTDFDEIYRLYFDDVYKYVLTLCRSSALAEEITQDSFFKALKSMDTYNGSCKIYVWLCQIAKNTYYSHYRKEKSTEKNAEVNHVDKEIEADLDVNDIEQRLVNKDQAFVIHQVLHAMEEPYKEVFMLRTFGELSFSKIGQLFGKTEGWARIVFHRAKKKIKESIQ